MADDLDRLMEVIEGEGPSPEFVQNLRQRIVAVTEGPAHDIDRPAARAAEPPHASDLVEEREAEDEIVVVFGRGPGTVDDQPYGRVDMHRRFQLLGAAAAVIVLVFGIWVLISDDAESELDTIDVPTSTTTTTPPAPDTDDGDELGTPLTAGNTFFDPGTFRIDTLGTEFSFSVEETRGLLLNENDIVLITDLTSRNSDDRTITFRRTRLLPDPAAPTATFDTTTGWPLSDLAGWLELVGDDVTATAPTSTMLGGVDATFVELEFACIGVDCVANLPTQTPELPMFTAGSRYRMWVVDQGQEDPIVVVVAIDDEDETGWFDEADGILATLEFGPVEPNPVRRVPAGAITLDVFDGISLDLPDEVVVVEPFDGFARIFPPGIGVDGSERPGLGWGGDVELLTRPLDTDGVEVTTTERLVELLEDEAVDLTELDAFVIGGFETRTFDLDSGGVPNVVLKLRPADLVRTEFGWESPRIGSLWVIEHPERGLMLVSAEVFAWGFDTQPLRPWTEALLRSLEFREL